MAHFLTPATTTAATSLSARAPKSPLTSWKRGNFPSPRVVCCVNQQYQYQASSISDHDQVPPIHEENSLHRRTLLGLSGAVVLALSLSDEQNANAAGRPPPPPPREKKDPNVSGVQAKVLASKRRKKAMKETMAKLREKGKPIIKEEPQEPPPAPE